MIPKDVDSHDLSEKIENDKENSEKVPTFFSQRWILAYLFFTGLFNVYAVRVNISVALVCMVKTPVDNLTLTISPVNNITKNDTSGGLYVGKQTYQQRGEFDWDKSTRSAILSSFFYGYMVTQIPGGWLADRFGGRRVFGLSMAIASVLTLLTPTCARISVKLVYLLRVILGLATGVVFPAVSSMLGRWAPRLERSKLVATAYVGVNAGIIGTFATSGLLCEYGFDNGWGSIFYITGGLCCIWTVVWFYQARDNPSEHPRITKAELIYITNNIEFDTSKMAIAIPWKAMGTSVVLWVGICCHMCLTYGWYTLITNLPVFMESVLKFDIKSNGALSSLPYICQSVMAIVAGNLADYLRKKCIFTTGQTRKLFQSIAFIGAGIFLVVTGFVPIEMNYLAVLFLCLAVSSLGFGRGGFTVNHIDVAPKFGGMMLGITNTMATIQGIVAPQIAGALTPNDTQEEWRNVFYVCAGFCLFGTIIYGSFARGEVQTWAKDAKDDESRKDHLTEP
ncbi:SLC17A5 [Mytilus coruscus]|uniref:Sialin n=1 Tax=Mytilus coruscus TaxID=42192 RepID=A0A6J8CUK8_MYTCO|nr:SLC17A5 [Mytilus coruscus]